MNDAIVVGSGPNGLAAAAALAREGVGVTVLEAEDEIGGGTRTSELTVPGVLHDHCSAVHPMGLASPFLRSLELERHGLQWRRFEIDLAHPLDDGTAGVMVKSLDETAAGLAADGDRWRRMFERNARNFGQLSDDILRPVLHVPKHPLMLTRFGLPTLAPATLLARRFATPQAKALFGGVAGHSYGRLDRPMSSSVGIAMITACHSVGWPVPKGGSRSISDALAAYIRERGGTIETGRPIDSLAELPKADAVLLDLDPAGVADLAGDRLPSRVARAYRRYKRAPAAFKVDLAVDGGIPWTNEACRRAGTVHVVGSFEELVAAEGGINAGLMPERPLVLVAQQYLADPDRSAGDVHPIWAYAHVPYDWDGDGEQAVVDQIERFAPGLRERIVGTATRSPAEFAAYNRNFTGGDVITGANTPFQTLIRPRLALDPYATGIPGVYICSAATPPGGGVHGMCGYNAAQSALRHLGANG